MSGSFTPFICRHADENLDGKLGEGIVIGIMMTAEGPQSMVLWEDQRNPSPSFHSPNNLLWLDIYEPNESDDDDEDDEDDEDENLELSDDDEEENSVEVVEAEVVETSEVNGDFVDPIIDAKDSVQTT
jgi:hypothetical protein